MMDSSLKSLTFGLAASMYFIEPPIEQYGNELMEKDNLQFKLEPTLDGLKAKITTNI